MKPKAPDPDRAARTPRLVGSVVDPAVDDGLGLSGPGAPAAFGGTGEHPVKARLLARARLARGEATEEDQRLLALSQARPAAQPPLRPVPSTLAAVPSAAVPSAAAPSAAVSSEELSPTSAVDARDSHAEPQPAPETREPGPMPEAIAQELERILGRAGPAAARAERPPLSPNLTALLGALLGLSLLTTAGLFLDQTTWDGPPLAVPAPPPPPEVRAPVAEPAPRPERHPLPSPYRVEDDKSKPGHRVISGKIGKMAFLKAIEEAGLPRNEAYRAYGALKETVDLDHCNPRDVFRALVTGREKRLVAFEYEKSKEEVYQAKPDASGRLSGQKLDLKVARNQIRRAFVHDGKSFDESAVRAGFDRGLGAVAEQAFRGHLGLGELKKGDRLRVIAQEVTVLGDFARYAGIEALEIQSVGKPPKRIYYYSHPSEGGYFDENGRAPYEGGWRKPITGAPVTSKFNMKRVHPILKTVMPHTGTDFGAPTGTPIGATAPGVVSFIGDGGPSGNLVKVKHDGGYESGYAHLSRFESGLKVGDPVDRMETVGYCGSTGRSTGPHLHFTMRKDGKYIDPESLNLDGLRVLSVKERPAFADVRQKYDAVLDAIVLPELPAADDASLVADATSSPEAEHPGDDELLPGDAPSHEAIPVAAAPIASVAPAPAPATVAPASPSPGAGNPSLARRPSAIFLSDSDLLKLQGSTHPGEVSE